MNQDWNNIRYFLAVVRSRSLADAARQLGVSHTTVFRRINAFEEDCGAALFNRQAAGYKLTAAGNEILASATRIEATINSFDRLLSTREVTLSGHIKLHTVDALLAPLQRDLLSLYENHPNIEVEFIASSSDSFDLDSGDAHMAIIPSNAPPDHLVGRKLGTSYCNLFGSRKYLERISVPVNEENLKQQKFVINLRHPGHLAWSQWLKANSDDIVVTMTCDSTANQLWAIKMGLGIGWLPSHVAGEFAELERILDFEDEPVFDIWMLTHPDMRNNKNINALRQIIQKGSLVKTLSANTPRTAA